MATIYDFAPTPLEPYQFSPTMDDRVVTARVVWSLFGKRWYLQMNELGGDLIFMLPVIGSLIGFHILSMVWLRGKVTLTTSFPHNFTVGNTVNLTIRGCVPDAYNGPKSVFVLTPTQFQFDAPSFPGRPLILGDISFDVNIAAGYFNTSTIVYRTANKQFEVSP